MLITRYTDLREWPKAIQDQLPLLSDKAWDWCKLELRDKAKEFAQRRFVKVLDAGSCVCKSNSLLPASFARKLMREAALLYMPARFRTGVISACGVTKVIDPSLYPLVYGHTEVLSQGGRVELTSLCQAYSHAVLARGQVDNRANIAHVDGFVQHKGLEDGRASYHHVTKEESKWTPRYQHLPCEVNFAEYPGVGVRISSYINDLPPEHPSLYRMIERIIDCAIPMWDECLIPGEPSKVIDDIHELDDQRQHGCCPVRIVAYGNERDFKEPKWVKYLPDYPLKALAQKYHRDREYFRSIPKNGRVDQKAYRKRLKDQFGHRPLKGCKMLDKRHRRKSFEPTPPRVWEKVAENLKQSGEYPSGKLPSDWQECPYSYVAKIARAASEWTFPEPGTAVSYSDWKLGIDVHRPAVDVASKTKLFNRTEGFHPPTEALYEKPDIDLRHRFREQGLQVIVEMSGIELTAVKPKYEDNTWRMADNLNEHVVATAIYVYDVVNITDCHLRFRQATEANAQLYRSSQNSSYHPIHKIILGEGEDKGIFLSMLGLNHLDLWCDAYQRYSAIQNQRTGDINMRIGRLITYPNVLQSSYAPFELLDPSQPGYFRFVKIHLVDPHYRICSTRNVPPQQHEWWANSVRPVLAQGGMPPELVEMVISECEEWPVGTVEAIETKEQLEREHRWTHVVRQNGQSRWPFTA